MRAEAGSPARQWSGPPGRPWAPGLSPPSPGPRGLTHSLVPSFIHSFSRSAHGHWLGLLCRERRVRWLTLSKSPGRVRTLFTADENRVMERSCHVQGPPARGRRCRTQTQAPGWVQSRCSKPQCLERGSPASSRQPPGALLPARPARPPGRELREAEARRSCGRMRRACSPPPSRLLPAGSLTWAQGQPGVPRAWGRGTGRCRLWPREPRPEARVPIPACTRWSSERVPTSPQGQTAVDVAKARTPP